MTGRCLYMYKQAQQLHNSCCPKLCCRCDVFAPEALVLAVDCSIVTVYYIRLMYNKVGEVVCVPCYAMDRPMQKACMRIGSCEERHNM